MKKIKSILRLAGLTMLVVLALCGMGFLGALFPVRRDYENKPINVERKDEKLTDASESESQE